MKVDKFNYMTETEGFQKSINQMPYLDIALDPKKQHNSDSD